MFTDEYLFYPKILERLEFNRCVRFDVINFIDKQNSINNNQYDFHPGLSTYMAMIDLVDKMCNAVENNTRNQFDMYFLSASRDVLFNKRMICFLFCFCLFVCFFFFLGGGLILVTDS